MSKQMSTRIAGFDVVLVPLLGSTTTTVRAIVNAGSAHESIPGTAHYLEHVLFKGTTEHTQEEITRAISRIGDHNAYTSCDRTVFYINTIGRSALSAFELLVEMLFHPLLDSEEIERERGVIREEMRACDDDPGTFFFRRADEVLRPGPVGRAVIGTPASVAEITPDTLREFLAEHYRPGNVAFVLAGDLSMIDVASVEATLAPYAKGLTPRTPNTLPTADLFVRSWETPANVEFEHPSQQAIVSLWLPSIPEHRDGELGWPMGVLSNALGGGMHSLVFQRVREELGLAYDVGAFEQLNWNNAALCMYARCDQANAAASLAAIRQIVERVAEEGIDEALFTTAISNYQFRLAAAQETPHGHASTYLDRFFSLKDHMEVSTYGFGVCRDAMEAARSHLPARIRERMRASIASGCVVMSLNASATDAGTDP